MIGDALGFGCENGNKQQNDSWAFFTSPTMTESTGAAFAESRQ
jgi:hypothetical protein